MVDAKHPPQHRDLYSHKEDRENHPSSRKSVHQLDLGLIIKVSRLVVPKPRVCQLSRFPTAVPVRKKPSSIAITAVDVMSIA
jgi:hypothetical protein